MLIIHGKNKPVDMPVVIEDRNALIGRYIRHNDSQEIFKITEVGARGITAYRAEGFGADVMQSSERFEITWASLKYKHKIMVHLADIDVKSKYLQ